MQFVWETMSNYLYFIGVAYKVEIYSFVLMNNHFHLIAKFPDGNISEAMNYFMRETSRVISRRAKRINQTYGGRYFKSAITKQIYLEHAYKYVYRNPIEAKLAERAEDYQYSTLGILLGKRGGVIPLVNDPLLEETLREATIEWINQAPEESDKEEVRKALKKTTFILASRNKGKFLHHLEVDRF